jgi:ribosomal protein S18 acetylase RimI-like enzyme
MSVEYKNIKDFTAKQLQELFLSVEWSSGHFPDKLVIAMKNYVTVYSAWDGEKLVGLISTMDDGVMTAYIHYLLVRPEYQGMGIGKELVRMTTEKYKDYLRILLIAVDEKVNFYKHCGFEVCEGSVPLHTTSL